MCPLYEIVVCFRDWVPIFSIKLGSPFQTVRFPVSSYIYGKILWTVENTMNSDHGIMTPQFIYDRYEQWSWMINDHNWSYDHWSWMINDHNWSYDHWSYMIGVHRCSYERWSSMINDHTDSCMNVLFMLWKAIDHSYDMLIIAMNRVLIMHDSIHNHVIMNIIMNPISNAII